MKRLSRTAKYLISIGILLIILNAILGFELARQSARAMRAQISDRMLDIANTAASMLDADALEVIQADDKDTPEYQTTLEILKYFQDSIELEYIYCIRDMGNKNFVFTIDPSEDPGEFGSPIVYTDALYKAILGTPAVDETAYEDEWGKFYSAYSPVKNSEGKVTGIVAVVFGAKWYEDRVRGLIWTTVLAISLGILFSALALFLIGSRYRKSFVYMLKDVDDLSNSVEVLVKSVSPEAIADNSEVDADVVASDDEIVIIGGKIHALQDRLGKELAYIRKRAYVDALTGLDNRAAYEEQVKLIEERMLKGTDRFSVAVFDINQLKIINDDYGHEEGDRVISAAAKAIKTACGEAAIYRIGGDEFVMICDGGNPEAKLSEVRKELERINKKETYLEIAVSMGCAIYNPERDKNYSDVFNRADNEMYLDKKEFYKTHEDRRKKK